MLEKLLQAASSLSRPEIICLIKKMIKGLSEVEVEQLLEELCDEYEMQGLLKMVLSSFDDWDSEEDAIYDSL